jgi:hypothetical protein
LPVGNEVRSAFPKAHVVFECADVYLEPIAAFSLEQSLPQKIFGVRNRSADYSLELVYDDAHAVQLHHLILFLLEDRARIAVVYREILAVS